MAKTTLGLDAKGYRNSGTYATPVWNEIVDIHNLSMTMEQSEADCSTRQSKHKLVKGALEADSIDFDMITDSTSDDWQALNTAFIGRTPIECAFMDGPIATAGSEGLRASFSVLKFNKGQNLEEVQMTQVTLKPTRSDNAPAWYVAP